MLWTLEVLKVIAALCANHGYPHIQLTCERNVIHCMVLKKDASADALVYCFTEDRGK